MRELSRSRTGICRQAAARRRRLRAGGKAAPPALINRGYGRSFFWDGRIVSLEEQVLKPIQDPNEMDLTLDEASSRVGNEHSGDISGSCELHPQHPVGRLPYDRFINGDRHALTADQQRGLQIFRGRGNCRSMSCWYDVQRRRLSQHRCGVEERQAQRMRARKTVHSRRPPCARLRARLRTCTTAPWQRSPKSSIFTAMVAGRIPFSIQRFTRSRFSDDEKRALI